jgi:hypothetical protein
MGGEEGQYVAKFPLTAFPGASVQSVREGNADRHVRFLFALGVSEGTVLILVPILCIDQPFTRCTARRLPASNGICKVLEIASGLSRLRPCKFHWIVPAHFGVKLEMVLMDHQRRSTR